MLILLDMQMTRIDLSFLSLDRCIRYVFVAVGFLPIKLNDRNVVEKLWSFIQIGVGRVQGLLGVWGEKENTAG